MRWLYTGKRIEWNGLACQHDEIACGVLPFGRVRPTKAAMRNVALVGRSRSVAAARLSQLAISYMLVRAEKDQQS